MNRRKIIYTLLCAVCLIASLTVTAFAHNVPVTAVGSTPDITLSIQYVHNLKAVPNVPFKLHYVASVQSNGDFALAGEFQRYPVIINGLDSKAWKALALTLNTYAERDNLTALDSGKTDERGTLCFPTMGQPKLRPGLYLVSGENHNNGVYNYQTEPFLIQLPFWDGNNRVWIYDVTAKPKYSAYRIPDYPTPKDPSTTGCKVLKVWDGDVETMRPAEVVIQLLKDGTIYDEVILNHDRQWQYIWNDLPKYHADGSEIQWLVAEKKVDGYTVSVDQVENTFVVTNTYHLHETPDEKTTQYHVSKVWDDTGNAHNRPKEITVSLYRNGVLFDSKKLSEFNGWNYTWDNLEKYDEKGKTIIWSVEEHPVLGYQTHIAQNGHIFIVTNRFENNIIPQTGQLWWPVSVLAGLGLCFLVLGKLTKGHHE